MNKNGEDRAHPVIGTKRRRSVGSDVWLARIFLLAVLAGGVISAFCGVAPGDVHLLPCPFHSITGVKCPGCGMTHACIALARGDIAMAWNYNPFSIGLILLAAGVAVAPHRMRRCWLRLPRSARTACGWSMLVLVFGFWIYRLTV
jgi:hypothetical protein